MGVQFRSSGSTIPSNELTLHLNNRSAVARQLAARAMGVSTAAVGCSDLFSTRFCNGSVDVVCHGRDATTDSPS